MTPTIRSTCTWPYPRHQTKKVATVRYLRTKCIVTVPTTRLGLPTAPSVGSRCLFVDSRVVNTRTDETMYMPVGGRKVNMTNELLIQMHLYRLNGLIDRSLGTVSSIDIWRHKRLLSGRNSFHHTVSHFRIVCHLLSVDLQDTTSGFEVDSISRQQHLIFATTRCFEDTLITTPS